ncbi:hypothetical protein CDD81_4386 [Ophiocordyceps australis]|uniref:N-alpha-acetyltransferase 40 n=1 Tax=Ophiocordyceps australis TaxID=1399860 RepID=A0A2C5YJA7_9HYPO|nr:hypothetical protein CDD81_4386 [Ophiocordyceps australis]
MTASAPDEVHPVPQTARRSEADDAIDAANNKSSDDFVRDYLRPGSQAWPTWTDARSDSSFTLSLVRAGDLARPDMQACFDLIYATSGNDYRRSAVGWHPAAKKREMASPELRYVLVRNDSGHIGGFASLMPTYENDEPVVYLYEIHLEPGLQGSRLGTHLMELVMQVADKIPTVTKVMLTCFTSNKRARAFYDRLGFVIDDSSPRQRKLRAGRTVFPDYVILSRQGLTCRRRRGFAGTPAPDMQG